MVQRLDQGGPSSKEPGTLAYRLSRLFELNTNPATRSRYSYQEVADKINFTHHSECMDALSSSMRERGEPEHEIADFVSKQPVRSIITAAYIGQLVNGLKDNPTRLLMQGLAGFFGIDPAFFFDGDSTRARELDAELELLHMLRNAKSDVLTLARDAGDLTPKKLTLVLTMVEQLRRLEEEPPQNSA